MITIHNGLYQGQFGFDKLHYLQVWFNPCYVLEWDHCIKFFGCRRKVRMGSDYRSPNYLKLIIQQMD
jgi:starch synthase